MVCGMVIASVGLGGRWPVWVGVVSLWLRVGERRSPSSVRLALTSVCTAVVTSKVASMSLQLPMLQPWMVMGLGMCIQSRGLRGSGLEGPMQDTALDWIPYPQGTEHCRARQQRGEFLQLLH